MRWIQDRGTATKMLLSFALVCALMAVVGAVGATTASGIEQRLVTVGDVNLPGIRALNQTRVAMITVQRDLRSALLTDDPVETTALVTSARTALRTMDEAYQAYKVLPASDVELRLMPVFEANRDAWRVEAERSLTESAKNTREGNEALAVDFLDHLNIV